MKDCCKYRLGGRIIVGCLDPQGRASDLGPGL